MLPSPPLQVPSLYPSTQHFHEIMRGFKDEDSILHVFHVKALILSQLRAFPPPSDITPPASSPSSSSSTALQKGKGKERVPKGDFDVVFRPHVVGGGNRGGHGYEGARRHGMIEAVVIRFVEGKSGEWVILRTAEGRHVLQALAGVWNWCLGLGLGKVESEN